MKKISVKFLLVQVVILLAVSAVVGIVVAFAMGGENPIAGGFRLMPLFLFFIALLYGVLGNMFTGPIAKKTMEKHSKKRILKNAVPLLQMVLLRLEQLLKLMKTQEELLMFHTGIRLSFKWYRQKNLRI